MLNMLVMVIYLVLNAYNVQLDVMFVLSNRQQLYAQHVIQDILWLMVYAYQIKIVQVSVPKQECANHANPVITLLDCWTLLRHIPI